MTDATYVVWSRPAALCSFPSAIHKKTSSSVATNDAHTTIYTYVYFVPG